VSRQTRTLAAIALIMTVLAVFFYVPVRRSIFNQSVGPDGSLQRIRQFGTANISLAEYLRTRGTRSSGPGGSETMTTLLPKPYALRIGGILLVGLALTAVSALLIKKSGRKQ